MRNKYVFFLLLQFLSLNVIAASDGLDNSTEWKLTQLSEDKNFSTSLMCETPPAVGGFQNCQLKIYALDSQAVTQDSGKLLKNATVDMEGGMPAHHHGLPTSPVISWSDSENAYVIKGLKYSMPGDWFLSFYIQDYQGKTKARMPSVFNMPTDTNKESGTVVKDKVSFKFVI